MKERPILFSGAMVRALLRDIDPKTQTRRIVKPQPIGRPWFWAGDEVDPEPGWFDGYETGRMPCGAPEREVNRPMRCPYGVPGDRLWVREAWRVGKPHDTTRPRDILPQLVGRGQGVTVLYEAGGARSVGPAGREEPVYPDDAPMPEWAGKLRPSMFMPRSMSRITLEVTDVRVERLQDISEDDAIAEGIETDDYFARQEYFDCVAPPGSHGRPRPIPEYQYLWDSLNAARGYGWDENPWVWVVEFKRIDA